MERVEEHQTLKKTLTIVSFTHYLLCRYFKRYLWHMEEVLRPYQ